MCKGLKVMCCECKKVLTEGPDDNVSHGYCDPCSIKFLWMGGLSQEELTDVVSKREEVTIEA